MPQKPSIPSTPSIPSPAIAALDQDLSLAAQTMKAASPEDKPRWKQLIDGLLDRRLELMRLEKPQAAKPAPF